MPLCHFQVIFKRINLIVMACGEKRNLCIHIFIRKLIKTSGHIPFYGSNFTATQEETWSITP